MHFSLAKTIQILERTPQVLNALLYHLEEDWIQANEGPDTFSPYDVVGHLIHGERKDWIDRMNIILAGDPDKSFTPFDRFAHYKESKGKSLPDLLVEFGVLRRKNLNILKSLQLNDVQLEMTALHPSLGRVSLKQLLSSWAVHDLSHLAQISRVMAKHYNADVGPWAEFMSILNR